MKGRPWTPQEDWYIEKYYRKRGEAWVAKRLKNRTARAVNQRAGRLGISTFDIPAKHVSIPDLAADLGISAEAVRAAARKDNVIEKARRISYVPDAWANRYRESMRARTLVRERWRAGHLSATQAAARMRVSPTGLLDALTEHTGHIWDAIKDIRVLTAECDSLTMYAFHPQDVEVARERIARKRPIGCLTLEQAAAELGFSVGHTHKVFRGEWIDGFRGRRMVFIPRDRVQAARDERRAA